MTRPTVVLDPARPLVVGSFGHADHLSAANPLDLRKACDVVEVRLDLLGGAEPAAWAHLEGVPLLFTARRGDEGGAGDLPAAAREEMIRAGLERAALVDIELASAEEMAGALADLKAAGVPWVASWHDFEGRADSFDRIAGMAARAAGLGAACFKAAVRLHGIGDVGRLAGVQTAEHPLPLALMGMGPLAPASRLLCAQHGSVLNYGFLGGTPTAPGQWSAALLRAAIDGSATGLS